MSRRFQFSLRALLVTVLAIALALGFKTGAKHRQTAAIARLRAKGAEITAEGPKTSRGGVVDELKSALGMDSGPVKVMLLEDATVFADEDVLLIGDVHDATDVWVSSDHITAKSLRAFSRLPNLQRLSLITASISDEELGELRRCKGLREMQLYLRCVGDAGLGHVLAMPQLERLCLYPVTASNDRLLKLAGLSRLKELVLNGEDCDPALETRLRKMLPQCLVVAQGTGLYLIGEKDE